MPIQRRTFCGSTKNSQTVSGLASIAIVRSYTAVSVIASMLLLLLLLCFAFERFEPDIPEAVEEVPQLDEPFGTCPVEAPGAVASLAHEARLLQDVQVLRDRRPRDLEVRRDLAGAELVLPDEAQDRAPPRLGDGFECSLHGGRS